MLSLARYRYALVVQVSFLGVHSLGLLLGAIYTGKTPDLYENNAHNKIGWIVTWIVLAQTVNGVIKAYEASTIAAKVDTSEHVPFLPISQEVIAQHQLVQGMCAPEYSRYSRDSGQGTEPESPRDESCFPPQEDEIKDRIHYHDLRHMEVEADFDEKQAVPRFPIISRFMPRFPALMPKRAIHLMNTVYDVVNGLILLLGFVAIASGIVVYGGIFVGLTSFVASFEKANDS